MSKRIAWDGTKREADAAVQSVKANTDIESDWAVLHEVIEAAVNTRASIVCWLVSVGQEDLARRVHEMDDEKS